MATKKFSCFLCEKAHLACDGQRPCSRCTKLGTRHMCIGAELGSGLAYSKLPGNAQLSQLSKNGIPMPAPPAVAHHHPQPAPVPQQQPHHPVAAPATPGPTPVMPVTPSVSTGAFKESVTTPSVNVQSTNPVVQPPMTPFTPSTPATSLLSSPPTTSGPIIKEVLTPFTFNPNLNGDHSSSSSININLNENNENQDDHKMDTSIQQSKGTGVFPSTKAPADVPGYQLNINTFLMQEMKKMKDEQRRLNDELLALKMQNLKLNSKYEDLHGELQIAKGHNNYMGLLADPQKAMVVFDLTKNPAIVLTTNDTFCKMLGYEMKEVLGAPWHKFIPAEYIERTMRVLAERSFKDSVIQMEQVYRHKDSGIFVTTDTHTLFFANGKPVSDLVFITLGSVSQNSNSNVSHAQNSIPNGPRVRVLPIDDKEKWPHIGARYYGPEGPNTPPSPPTAVPSENYKPVTPQTPSILPTSPTSMFPETDEPGTQDNWWFGNGEPSEIDLNTFLGGPLDLSTGDITMGNYNHHPSTTTTTTTTTSPQEYQFNPATLNSYNFGQLQRN